MGRRKRRQAKPKQRIHRFVQSPARDWRGALLDRCAICSLGSANACHPTSPDSPADTAEARALTARILGEHEEYS